MILVGAIALSTMACKGEAEKTTGDAKAAPSAEPEEKKDAAPKMGGEMEIDDEGFLKMKEKLEVGTALAYPSDGELRVVLVSKNMGERGCDHDFGFGHEVKKGQLALELKSKSYKYDAGFEGKAGKLEHVGYTYYWNNDGEKGTNSGNSARDDLDSELEITSIDDETVVGTFRIKKEAKGTFTAKVCKQE